ncbi:MaoC/PaaZ C-terminal domain-containing protein [Nevskia sp.]|uniref:MaoC family dehydratase n=1 Tax=Nevskia sp. TaxID=1929292 RepID=UPI0025F32ACD|nr:MaoC/PaaZ C-terminal domain-containing protein [Nevskia sp.]
MSTTTARVFDLPALPPVLPAFARAALSASRKVTSPVAIPEWTVRVGSLGFDRPHVAAYNALCGFNRADQIAMTYPQVLATPLYLNLMTRSGFPLPLMGLVHVRNRIEMRRELSIDENFDVSVSLGASREVRAGLELDLIVSFSELDGDVLWKATMTVLKRGPKRDGDAPAATTSAPQAEPGLAQYLTISAPEDIGRRYARISQDFNPIHLYATSAKLFGFKRAIAHGLWTKARVLAELSPRLAQSPRLFDVQFRQPLLLPGRATLRYVQESARIDYALLEAAGGKVHLAGTLR